MVKLSLPLAYQVSLALKIFKDSDFNTLERDNSLTWHHVHSGHCGPEGRLCTVIFYAMFRDAFGAKQLLKDIPTSLQNVQKRATTLLTTEINHIFPTMSPAQKKEK